MNENSGSSASPSGAAQAAAPEYLRPGLTTITPYLVVNGAAALIDFLKAAFDGVERLRVPTPNGSIMHAEVAIGNGAIELADANPRFSSSPADIHLYVPNCDETYERAIRAGATSVYPVADQHWGDRQGAVNDAFGNHWYIATPGWTPGPEGVPSVQPFLHLHQADKMIPFMEAAFEAEALGVAKSPEGFILHATIRIGNATLEIDEARPGFEPKPCHLHIYVPNTDAAYQRAIAAGAVSIEEPQDKPYGDRSAGVKDPFGNSWFLATYLGAR